MNRSLRESITSPFHVSSLYGHWPSSAFTPVGGCAACFIECWWVVLSGSISVIIECIGGRVAAFIVYVSWLISALLYICNCDKNIEPDVCEDVQV